MSQLIQKYFPRLSTTQYQQFGILQELYEHWNAQINVISRKDIEHFYERHVLHSLGISKVCSFADGSEVLDVGTGGGFPGIPLAIMFPEVEFHLVDSIGKKIKVVAEIKDALKLNNVKAEHQRVENLDHAYDFVVSRAVTRMESFVKWVQNKINRNHFSSLENGILYLKGGDLTEELNEVGRKFNIYQLSSFFEEDFFETKKVVHLPF